MSALVRIVVTGEVASVYSPFAARDVVKGMPGRVWVAAGKFWTVPADVVPTLVAALTEAGFHPLVVHKRESAPPPPPPPPASERGRGSWAHLMFRAIPGRLHVAVFRALVAVLHPDRDGDLESMQTLTAARDMESRPR